MMNNAEAARVLKRMTYRDMSGGPLPASDLDEAVSLAIAALDREAALPTMEECMAAVDIMASHYLAYGVGRDEFKDVMREERAAILDLFARCGVK